MPNPIYLPKYTNPFEAMLPQFLSSMILQDQSQKFRERMMATEQAREEAKQKEDIGIKLATTEGVSEMPTEPYAAPPSGNVFTARGKQYSYSKPSHAPTPFTLGGHVGVYNKEGTVSWAPGDKDPTTAMGVFLKQNPNATPEQAAKYQQSLSSEKQPRPVVTWKTPTGETLNLREGDMPPEGSVKQGIESPNFATNDNFSTWSPQQKEFAFENYKLTGQPPKFYYRDKESLNAFNKEMSDYFASHGEKPSDLKAAQTSLAGLKTSLQTQEKTRGMMGGFVRNMDKQINRVEEIHKDLVSRLGLRIVDLPLREIKTRAIGSGDEQVINSYLIEISNEIGKLSTGSAASIRELSVDAQERWAKIHDPNLSFKEIMKVLNTTKEQGQMRIDSQNEELLATKEKIGKLSEREPVKKGKLNDPATAKKYLDSAKGDKNKARELAKQDGWEF